MEEATEKTKFESVARSIETEMTVNAELIQLIAGGEYLLQLVDPGIKLQIGQQAAKKLFGL
jgi:hypothetical protein